MATDAEKDQLVRLAEYVYRNGGGIRDEWAKLARLVLDQERGPCPSRFHELVCGEYAGHQGAHHSPSGTLWARWEDEHATGGGDERG